MLKPYTAYKRIALPWLHTIPEEWNLRRAKTLLRPIDIRSTTGTEELLTVSSDRGVVPRRSTTVNMFKAKSYTGYKLCWPGDLVINSLWAWGRGLGVTRQHGIISSAYGVYRSRRDDELNSDYLHHLVRSAPYNYELQVRSKGIWKSRLQLTDDAFLTSPLPLPPIEEQRAIVRFLNYIELRVRSALKGKQQLMLLLDQSRKAVIQEVITQGLSGSLVRAALGAGDCESLPAGWRIRRIKTLVTSIDQGVSPQAEAGLANASRWGVLKSGCANGGIFRETEHKRLPPGFVIDPTIAVKEGDILVSRACGSPRFVGSAALVGKLNFRLILSDKIFRLNLRNPELADFMVLAMNTSYFRSQVEREISGAEGLANNLPLTALKGLRILLPEPSKAKDLAAKCRSAVRRFESQIETVASQITAIQEYRTRLVADVVTGRLKVLEMAERLSPEWETEYGGSDVQDTERISGDDDELEPEEAES